MALPTALEHPQLPDEMAPTEASLAHLAGLAAGRSLVVSCYVRLEVPDRVANRYRLAVREALRPLPDLPGGHADREMVRRDLRRITDFLADAHRLPHSPGLVLFGCEALELFAAMPLPRVTRTRATLDTRPRLAEAAAVAPESGPVLVAALDRAHARFFRVLPGAVEELPGLAHPARRGGKFHSDRADAPGWGEHDYHDRIREERHRHAALVAERLGRMLAEDHWVGVVLGGPARVTAAQTRFLPQAVRQRVIHTVRLNPTAVATRELLGAGVAAREAAQRRKVAALLEEFEAALGTGWAVSGGRSTLRALALGQVRVLLVRAGLSGRGVRCAASGRLAMSASDCRGEGEPVPVGDLVNEVIEEAWRQRVEVAQVDDPGARRLDGLGAILRFRSRNTR